jgi:hypothetical protein
MYYANNRVRILINRKFALTKYNTCVCVISTMSKNLTLLISLRENLRNNEVMIS